MAGWESFALDEVGLRQLMRIGGPIEPDLMRHAQAAADTARNRAPIGRANADPPPGTLRDGIVLRPGETPLGMYVDVVSTAKNRRGFPYGNVVNKREPFLDVSDFR
jgi:hypothetical protein